MGQPASPACEQGRMQSSHAIWLMTLSPVPQLNWNASRWPTLGEHGLSGLKDKIYIMVYFTSPLQPHFDPAKQLFYEQCCRAIVSLVAKSPANGPNENIFTMALSFQHDRRWFSPDLLWCCNWATEVGAPLKPTTRSANRLKYEGMPVPPAPEARTRMA